MAWNPPFDPFAKLGLPRDANQKDIQSRYRELARRYHPNRNQAGNGANDGGLADHFHQINQAWEQLAVADVRRRYVELLDLHDQHEAVLATFADLLQAGESTSSHQRHRGHSIGEDRSSSGDDDEADDDEEDDDDEDLPRIAGIKRRTTFEQQHQEKHPLQNLSKFKGGDGTDAERQKKTRFADLKVSDGSGPESAGNDRSSAAMRRKKYDRLRKKELESFLQYQDAMLDKFEAEQHADTCRDLYEQAKWRREYFERAPKEIQQQVKLARLINNAAKAFKSLQTTRHPNEATINGNNQIKPGGDPHGTKKYLGLPSRVKSIHRRGWSSDLSGDQTSSDEEEYHSDKATSPSRSPRASSPRPFHYIQKRQISTPGLLTVSPHSLPNGIHEPISPIAGPVKVFVRQPTNLHELHDPQTSDADTASASSRSPSVSPRSESCVAYTLIPSNFAGTAHSREERRSRSPSSEHRAPGAGHSRSDSSHLAADGPRHFMIKHLPQLGFRSIPITHVHDLSIVEKQWLLGMEADADMDPHVLLHHLQDLDPSVARKFMVKPDIMAKFHFRLIYNRQVIHKQQNQTFIALSYRRKLHVEKKHGRFTLPLEPEMFQAVWDERQSDAEGVWIDQICINGESDGEKTVSMSAMDMVYRSARLVVVALDDVLLESHEGALLSAHMQDYDRMSHVPANKRFRRRKTPYLDAHEDLYGVIRKLLRSSWFRRAWCRHEMRLAREHVFLVPCNREGSATEKCVVRFTGKCLTHFLGLATEVIFDNSIEGVKAALYSFFRDRSRIAVHEQDVRSHHGNFTTVIAEVFAMEAGGDPKIPEQQRAADARKDKIAIILNTMECGLALRPGVRDPRIVLPTPECHYLLLVLALAARDPGALSAVGHPLLQLPDAPYRGQVASTWLFAPTNVDSGLNNYKTLHRLPKHFHIATSAENGHHYVELDLKFVGSGKVLHSFELPDTMEQAGKFMAYCTKERLGRNRTRYLVDDKTGNRLFGSMYEVYVETLACVLECGPDWLSQVCQRYGVSRWRQDLQLACELLIALNNTCGRWPETSWNSDAAGFVMDFVNFLIIRGMPQRQITEPENWRPVWVSHPAGGRVVTFVPPGNIRAAVPAALLDTDYIHLARLWVLEPRDEYDEDTFPHHKVWTLLGKSVLFSDDEAIEHLSVESGLIRSHQKVFGRAPTSSSHVTK